MYNLFVIKTADYFLQVNPLGGAETRSVASLRYRRSPVTVMASDAVRRTVPCHDVRVGVPASWGGMLSAVLPDVGTRSVASLHVCIDHFPASQANSSKREANSSKREANPSKCKANTKQTQANAKQTQANAKQT